jgi:hypothetical protein
LIYNCSWFHYYFVLDKSAWNTFVGFISTTPQLPPALDKSLCSAAGTETTHSKKKIVNDRLTSSGNRNLALLAVLCLTTGFLFRLAILLQPFPGGKSVFFPGLRSWREPI